MSGRFIVFPLLLHRIILYFACYQDSVYCSSDCFSNLQAIYASIYSMLHVNRTTLISSSECPRLISHGFFLFLNLLNCVLMRIGNVAKWSLPRLPCINSLLGYSNCLRQLSLFFAFLVEIKVCFVLKA